MDFFDEPTMAAPQPVASVDERETPRFTMLIRTAKLLCPQGEFVCVLRDVSTDGVSIRMFHDLPDFDRMAIELETGDIHDVKRMWIRDREAGFRFSRPVDVENVLYERGQYPKRKLRMGIEMPVVLCAGGRRRSATITNLSQQGARVQCDALFALDENLRFEAGDLPEIEAKVRWRQHDRYGVVFENTFQLSEFAQLVAQLQCPTLLGIQNAYGAPDARLAR